MVLGVGARLPANVEQVTTSLIRKTRVCADVGKMRADLSVRHHAGTRYYRVQAVLAHENLHVDRFDEDMDRAFDTLQSAIEIINIPVAEVGGSRTSAENAARSRPEFGNALKAFEDKYNASSRDEVNHVGGGYFEAEVTEMSSYKRRADERFAELGCS